MIQRMAPYRYLLYIICLVGITGLLVYTSAGVHQTAYIDKPAAHASVRAATCSDGFLLSPREEFWQYNSGDAPGLTDVFESENRVYAVFNIKIHNQIAARTDWHTAAWSFKFHVIDQEVAAQTFGPDPQGTTFIVFSPLPDKLRDQPLNARVYVNITAQNNGTTHVYGSVPFCTAPSRERPSLQRKLVGCIQILPKPSNLRILPEWIAYHLLQGYQHIFVYANGDPDEVRALLQPVVRDGKATVIDWHFPPKYDNQFVFQQAYEHSCILRSRGQSRWIALHDVDEYMYAVRNNETVGQYVRSFFAKSPNVAGLQVRSWWYGPHSSGAQQLHFQEQSNNTMITKFVTRDAAHIPDGREKCIIVPEQVDYFSVHLITKGGSMHNPDPITELRLAHLKNPPWANVQFSFVDLGLYKYSHQVFTQLQAWNLTSIA